MQVNIYIYFLVYSYYGRQLVYFEFQRENEKFFYQIYYLKILIQYIFLIIVWSCYKMFLYII